MTGSMGNYQQFTDLRLPLIAARLCASKPQMTSDQKLNKISARNSYCACLDEKRFRDKNVRVPNGMVRCNFATTLLLSKNR